ncbi:MAG: type II toxin-antitoxin system PemK/MazF family toxin [Candidatus Paceibacterota bacterium]|jgi:mRNA interferase MazF
MKDFKEWGEKKTSVEKIEHRPFFHEKEIWVCHLGLNIGFEQDGKGEDFVRPIVIIKKFNNQIFWGIPLTKSVKRESPYYFNFSFTPEILSSAILSQIKLTDSKRLGRMIGRISQKDFSELTKKLKDLIP